MRKILAGSGPMTRAFLSERKDCPNVKNERVCVSVCLSQCICTNIPTFSNSILLKISKMLYVISKHVGS